MCDKNKLIEVGYILDDALRSIEDLGEFNDYDLDQVIEGIYKAIEGLSVDVYMELIDRGFIEASEIDFRGDL